MDREADQKGEGPQRATHFYGLQNKSNGICFCNETGGHLEWSTLLLPPLTTLHHKGFCYTPALVTSTCFAIIPGLGVDLTAGHSAATVRWFSVRFPISATYLEVRGSDLWLLIQSPHYSLLAALETSVF